MRLAKLDYLKNSSPAFANPYYWAAYEVLGNNAPVTGYIGEKILIITVVILICAGIALIYFKRYKYFLPVHGKNHLILPDIQSNQ